MLTTMPLPIQSIPSSRELLPLTLGALPEPDEATGCDGSSGPEYFGYEGHAPIPAALQQLSIGEETAFLTGQSPSIHDGHNPALYTDALEICNTDWLGRTKAMTDNASWGIRANSQTGGGC